MRLGQAAMEALRAEITGCLKPGDELAVSYTHLTLPTIAIV